MEIFQNKWINYADYVSKINIFNNDIKANIEKSLRYYYSFQEICKSKKLPYKAFQMLHIFRGWYSDTKRGNYKIKEDRFIKKEFLNFIHNSFYFNKIDDNFIGFPSDPDLGGFSIKNDILGGYEKKGIALEWAVSKKDSHPNAKGQEKIAEFIYDRLG